MKALNEIKELRELSREDLFTKVESLKEELMKLRFRGSSGQLAQSAKLSDFRKSIARAKTVLAEIRE